jgi:5'(3')-deoxyribonucleotidase
LNRSGRRGVQRIAVDMDEVLADALAELIRRYNEDFGERLTKQDLDGRWMWDAVPSTRHDRLLGYLHSVDFFEDLPVIPESQRVVERLNASAEVFIATAAMEFPNSFTPKYRWLERHFPFLSPHRFVFCGDKSILHADYLIDDMPRHFGRFAGTGLLFTSPHNAREKLPPGGPLRMDDWLAVERYFFG